MYFKANFSYLLTAIHHTAFIKKPIIKTTEIALQGASKTAAKVRRKTIASVKTI